MKKGEIKPIVRIVYKDDAEARNKLINYIINFLLDSNIKDLVDNDAGNNRGDYRKND